MLTLLVALLLRVCVSLHSHSGENKPPMYGDYEAQRHWMEVTYNLPVNEWYFNTSDNDLLYWGLDYPPLTAYHSLIYGYIGSYLNPQYVELHSSRGYESLEHKLFMRCSVLLVDLLLFIPGVWIYFTKCETVNNKVSLKMDISPLFCVYNALIYPGLILIDHGHFQYNCVSLGLFICAVAAVIKNKNFFASVFFCLSLSYKQMQLYHSLPFFFYFLGTFFKRWKKCGFSEAFRNLRLVALGVILTFVLVWFPFITNTHQFFQVLHRIFPVARGVFEDKVANIWCTLNVIYKLRFLFSNEEMAKICIIITLLTVLPCSLDLFLNPTVTKFKLALINSSLSFFLFSFQVHEKSILLTAIPVLLYFPNDPFPCFWFLLLSAFSMLPLFIKDNLFIPFVSLSIFYLLSLLSVVNIHNFSDRIMFQKPLQKTNRINLFFKTYFVTVIYYSFYSSITLCVLLSLCISCISPPVKYPDLFPLLISVYSCLHFVPFFLYFNYKQLFKVV